MSYCVNCGVELEKTQKRCPLCSTPVINPNETEITAEIPPYPSDNVVGVVRKLRRMAALLISIILFVPFLLCPLCDLLITGRLTWSMYTMLSIELGWIYIVPPILLRHNAILKCAWIDYFSTIIFLYCINMIFAPKSNWAFEIAFPILSYIMAVVLIYAALTRRFNISVVVYVAMGLIFVAIMSLFVEYIINSYNNISGGFVWAVPVMISCLGVALILIVVSKMTKLKALIKKIMHT